MCYLPKSIWLAVVLLSPIGVGPLAPQGATAGEGEHWAVLVGVEKYHRATRLRFTNNDVDELARTLIERSGYDEDHILKITDAQSNPRYQPLRASLMAELPKWLALPEEGDHVLVYFSGHGFRDAKGQLYLAPLDCDPANPEETGVPVSWLREQLADCPAGFKLLVLDSCHAGSEKGDGDKAVPAGELGQPFRDVAGVVTLASSKGEEKSQLWEEKRQSLFTYWLNQGLKGHADRDGNSRIDIDELYGFVHRNVAHSAKVHFPRAQTPVRIVRSGIEGVPVVAQLEPRGLKDTINDIAEQLAWALEERAANKVGVLEFTSDTQLGELLGADFGLLGRYCQNELQRRLMELGGDRFAVVDRRRLQHALRAQGFTLDDLGSPEALEGLSQRLDGMPIIALGTLRNRAGRVVTLSCNLVRTDSDALAGSAGGSALLNESEWAMLGRSVHVKQEDRRPVAPALTDSSNPEPARRVPTQEDRVIERLDRRSQEAHPLADTAFPFRVRIMVGGRERRPRFEANKAIVTLKKGETYEIWVENRSGKLVNMRLLVDGLNTLPEKEQTKGVETWLVAPRVSLDEARHWILDPKTAKVAAVRGFFTATGAGGRLREFKVVDAQESVAARQKFTDQIGMITAAFYDQASGSRRVGTGFGAERDEQAVERKVAIGNLLAVVHIHYTE